MTFYINNNDSEVADKMNSVTYDVAFLSSSQFSSIENKKDLNSVAVQNVTYSFIFNQNDNNYRNKNMRLAFAARAILRRCLTRKAIFRRQTA